MSTVCNWLFSAPASAALSRLYQTARARRGMPAVIAITFTALTVLAYALLTLEGARWQQLRVTYRPWFQHLLCRKYQHWDPVRYALQGLWLLFVPVEPRPHKRSGFLTLANRAITSAASTYALLRDALVEQINRIRRRAFGKEMWLKNVKRSRLPTLVIGAFALSLGMLLVTQPFTLMAQAMFVVILWSLAMIVRRVPGHFSTLMLMALSALVSTRYIWWRYTSTLYMDDALDTFFSIGLLAAETYSWVILILGYIQTALPLKRKHAPLPADTGHWPVVDVMIPTYNEDLSVVAPTVYAALGIDWPADKLRIHLLDDGKREVMRQFALEAGVNYIVRPDNTHAKAGNLNHALSRTDGELVAIFDCDHIPTRSFLQLTVGWFLKDPKLALVQTPHHFFSPDPFERNLGQHLKQPSENTLFYGLVQDGNDLWNAAFFCGSCAVLKRTALESIGGFAVETVTEDAHTALRLHRNGYSSAYLRIPQAAGLATESLSAHVGQRIRWARGMAQIFRLDNPLKGKGLSIFQRLCYTNAMLHFLAGIPRLVYLTAPLAFLVFHSYIVYAPAIAILLNVVPHMAHALITNSHLQGSYRRTFWGEVYETVLAWYIARPTTVALFAPHKGSFNVTAKGGLVETSYFDWSISRPYVILALLNLTGFGFGIWRLVYGPADEILTVVITMTWVAINLAILGTALAVAAEMRQVRKSHRVATSLPAMVLSGDGHLHRATISDYSEGGAAVSMADTTRFQLGEPITLVIPSRNQRRFSFPARISRTSSQSLGLQFQTLSRQQHIDLVQCTFARADSWLSSQYMYAHDRPLSSLSQVALTSLRGYVRASRHLPFPLNALLNKTEQICRWIVSLLPQHRPTRINFEPLA